MKAIRIIPAVLLVSFLISGCRVQFNGRDIGDIGSFNLNLGSGNWVERSEVLRQAVDTQKALEVRNSSGEIILKPSDQKEVEVTVIKKIRTSVSRQKAEDILDQIKVGMQASSTKVEIDVNYNNYGTILKQQNVRLEIKVPRQLENIKGDVTSGEIEFSGFTGAKEVKLTASSGKIKVEDSEADKYELQLTSGSMDVDGLKGDGYIRASSGNIHLERLVGKLRYKATSGDIRITDVDGTIDAELSSGSIEVSNAILKAPSSFYATSGRIQVNADRLDGQGNYKFNASSGNIRLRVPESMGFSIDAHASSGNVRSDFDVAQKSSGRWQNELVGTVGGGGPMIIADVSSGDISIQKNRGK